jgi:luciferase family oxidoreductase group 1
MPPLSILDLSPVATGSSGAQALQNTLDLARLGDRLGYVRYWVAEHHNMPMIASSAPDIMIGQIAAATSRMRVGSGGVMLPNHSPLQVAERFKVLEALFPGRIDLGLGRAPGTDPVTSYALRRRQDQAEGEDDFLDRFQELLLFEQRGFPAGHPFAKVQAMPADVPLPPIYLLGSSGYSAELAAAVGAGFSFAHHFSDFDPVGPMLNYRAHFKPGMGQAPLAIVGVHAIVADTDAEAEYLAGTVDLNFARRRQGQYLPLPSPEEAAAYAYSPADRQLIAQNRARLIVGSKDTVRAQLEPLVETTQADEVMVTTMIYDHAARRHSYELLAEAFGLQQTSSSEGDVGARRETLEAAANPSA